MMKTKIIKSQQNFLYTQKNYSLWVSIINNVLHITNNFGVKKPL